MDGGVMAWADVLAVMDRCCYCGRQVDDQAGLDGHGHPICCDCADGDEMDEARRAEAVDLTRKPLAQPDREAYTARTKQAARRLAPTAALPQRPLREGRHA